MAKNDIIEWLLSGDISIQYQVYRDLFGVDRKELKNKIEKEGWAAQFLSLQNQNGHWGTSFYQPKWTSTHYTLLDLKNLCISNRNKACRQIINQILKTRKAPDGGINPAKTVPKSDVCVCGMFLNYACYFNVPENNLKSIVDFILTQQMQDGGFNCHSNIKKAFHSSLHTTLSILEGIHEYEKYNYTYRLQELKKASQESVEFMLQHKLYQSHRTGKTIDKKMLMLSYPSRWRYDILRALDYFQNAGIDYDVRMDEALKILKLKQRSNKTWNLQAKHIGQVHFDMEEIGKPSRWNTLRALRVLRHFIHANI
jgi:hypothetical protein